VSAKVCKPVNKCNEQDPKKPICPPDSTCLFTEPGKFKCGCKAGFRLSKKQNKCVEIVGCASNPCSKYAKCSRTAPGQFKCQCITGFSGDGIKCTVQPGSKAVVIGGKMQIVPLVKGDVHDEQLGVIEAMLGKMSSEEPTAVAKAFGGSAQTIGLGAGANPTPTVAQTDEERSRLEAVRRRVATLEKTTEALADAAKRETEELKKLRDQSAAENERVLKALTSKADGLLDTVTDQTHDIITHTPHDEGGHLPTMNIGNSKSL